MLQTDSYNLMDEVAGGASGMGVNRIGEIGDVASEEQATGCMRQVLLAYDKRKIMPSWKPLSIEHM